MNWARKHLCDLAWVCKACGSEPDLSPEHQESFANAHQFAKQLSSLPEAGGASNVATAVTAMCNACQRAYTYDCQGRDNWLMPCQLMQNRLEQQ